MRVPLRTVALALAVLVVAPTVAAAQAGAPAAGAGAYRAGDYADGHAFSILPPGTNGLVDAPQAVAFEAGGARPANSADQLTKYAALLYGAEGLRDTDLGAYYEDESFGVAPGRVRRVEHPGGRPVVILRDEAGIPHIYGATSEAAAYGVGYAQAEDRLFLMDVLRHYGRGTLSSFLGPSCAFEQMDHDELLLAPYTERQATAQLDALPRRYGDVGVKAKRMVEAYVGGVNAYLARTIAEPSLLPADYAAAAGPPQPWTVADVVYVASLIGGIFGKGGGGEIRNAALLQYLGRFGAADASSVFADLKEQDDPEAPTTITDHRFAYDTPGAVRHDLTAMPDNAAAPLTGGPVATTPGCDLTPPNAPALAVAQQLARMPAAMSNALVVDAAHSASGHPLAVFGPQVSYFAPEILMQEDVHAPGYEAEGASFPGTGLVELGRGADYAWSATSASSDIVDERLEQICNPDGGAPDAHGTSYLYAGRCVPMTHEDFSEVAAPKPGGAAAPAILRHDIYRTRHGIVQGWTTAGGRPVAVVDQRSTYGREVDSAVGFLEWGDPDATHDAASWMRGAADIGYTFNWFYVDDRDVAYYVSGRDPVRAPGVDPNLPTWGTGAAEWRGFLPPGAHPHEVNPRQGFFVSWNNKPAPGFAAADSTFSYGPTYRSQSLVAEIQRELRDNGGRITLANLVTAMERGATADLDGRELLPRLLPVARRVASGRVEQAMVERLARWLDRGAHRRKAKAADAQYADAAAVAIMDELEPHLIRAFFDPLFAAGGVRSYSGDDVAYDVVPMEWVNAPNNDGGHLGSAYDDAGWLGYELKLLRQVAGDDVAQPLSPAWTARACGPAGLNSCASAVARALRETAAALEAANGTPDVASWTVDTAAHTAKQTMPRFDAIEFRAIGVVGQPPIDWQNRPTFQQAVTFPRHRPR